MENEIEIYDSIIKKLQKSKTGVLDLYLYNELKNCSPVFKVCNNNAIKSQIINLGTTIYYDWDNAYIEKIASVFSDRIDELIDAFKVGLDDDEYCDFMDELAEEVCARY